MGTTIAFIHSPGKALLFIVISSNLARYGNIASPSYFKISPGIPSCPTNFFLPFADNRFLIMLILMVKDLPHCVDWIWMLLLSQMNRDTWKECRDLAFSTGSLMSLTLWSLIAGIFPLFPLRRLAYLQNSVQRLHSFCKTERKNVSWAFFFATSNSLDNLFSSTW